MYTETNPEISERWWDWLAVCLLLAALLPAAPLLNATEWADHLNLVQTVAFLGALAGLALGQSLFSPSVARLLAFVYGLFTIGWPGGLTPGGGGLWAEWVG